MANITLNSTAISPQPSTLLENYIEIQTDNIAIDGTRHRYWANKKKHVEMSFSKITDSEYQTLRTYLANQGATVVYNNPNTGFGSFTGLATITASEFIHGATFRRDATVVIEEV